MGNNVLFIHGLAFLFRLLIVNSSWSKCLQIRPEIVTPVNSPKRLLEGVSLYRDGISPYNGDAFHEQPFLLFIAMILMKWPPLLNYIFLTCDHLAAWLLGKAAINFLQKLQQLLEIQEAGMNENADVKSLVVNSKHMQNVDIIVQICYLFSPYSVLTCTASASTTLHNLLIVICLYFLISNRPSFASLFLALVSLLCLYPCLLIVPIILHVILNNQSTIGSLVKPMAIFVSTWTISLLISAKVLGSWTFLDNTYGFLISVPDLTPNVGLFWYFFTEVFDHFRLFFLWVFQLNIFIYAIPLALTLRRSPVMLFEILLILIAVFKPYPSVGDTVVYMAFLPVWRHLYKYIRHGLVIACTVTVLSALSPVMWKLWMYDGSANANFYFAISLTHCTAQIFLLTDLLYAQLRHNVHIRYGTKVQDKDGNEAEITLL